MRDKFYLTGKIIFAKVAKEAVVYWSSYLAVSTEDLVEINAENLAIHDMSGHD